MPPKKKGKKEKKDPNKISLVDRTFYELTITDLNQKLARLRSHLSTLDESNIVLNEKLKDVENDRTDVAAHLERTLAERNNSITELEERLVEITKVRDEENRIAQEKIFDLESKYKAMHDQLTSEIKLLNGKLNSLDEFRIQRDILLAKFDDQEADLKEKEKEQKEALYNMEQRAVVEKDALKKEVEQKLLQVSEDFTRSSEIRNAGYTRRLIRENIALQKEIDLLVMSQIKLQQQYTNQKENHKEIEEQYSALDQIKNELVRNSVNKIKIIEGLTKNYEKLKAKYVEVLRYRKAYEAKQMAEKCEQVKQKEAVGKLRALSKHMEILSLENKNLAVVHDQHENEIVRLRGMIQEIKVTVRDAIIAEKSVKQFPVRLVEADVDPPKVIQEVKEEAVALCKLARIDLLSQLMNIVSSHSEELPRTPSVVSIGSATSSLYVPGKMGFMPQKPKATLFEIFRSEVVDREVDTTLPDYLTKNKEKEVVTTRRRGDELSIIDVEFGTTLYVSSSREDDLIEVEEEPLEEPEGSSSDVSMKKPSSEGSAPPPATAPLAVSVEDAKTSEIKSIKSTGTADSITGVTRTSGLEEIMEEEDDDLEINLFY
ncbi:cilia- and flagella-associated protein 157 [Drosophila persimilis]|uniref:Cilia- and flagella-associated protein 157 n=1 Tax=Drosophila pseudoobscura pseudoobscura TaxID=46245 RepID=A0A0R3P3C1_DROPS|nr:cilia- and flagella-associated protein 157 [Drosophila pseudoobscura]XP_026845491.1 cilia- and flagella-associated protein 157 [Drosophila persimilis]